VCQDKAGPRDGSQRQKRERKGGELVGKNAGIKEEKNRNSTGAGGERLGRTSSFIPEIRKLGQRGGTMKKEETQKRKKWEKKALEDGSWRGTEVEPLKTARKLEEGGGLWELETKSRN